MSVPPEETLLAVRDLEKAYPVHGGVFLRRVATVRAVAGLSFDLAPGDCLGLVGESGCGKTTVGRAVLRLVEPTAGRVLFQGRDVLAMGARELRGLRARMQMVFQDPNGSLDPRQRILDAVREPLDIQGRESARRRDERARAMLDRVGIPAEAFHRLPHEFSGGQRQRVGIARALVTGPLLLVADEPVSALDASVQAQVVNLLGELRDELGLTMLFISHDLGVVEHLCDRVAVMYLGRIVEEGSRQALFEGARHPYTLALLSAVPSLDPDGEDGRILLEGDVPSPMDPPPGCPFHPRCPLAETTCMESRPELLAVGDAMGHRVACHRAAEAREKMLGSSRGNR